MASPWGCRGGGGAQTNQGGGVGPEVGDDRDGGKRHDAAEDDRGDETQEAGGDAGLEFSELVARADEDHADGGDAAAHRVGRRSWSTVWRMTTLMLSAAPKTNRAASDNSKECERPKTIVAMPKTTTVMRIARPPRLIGGRRAMMKPMRIDPMAGIAHPAKGESGFFTV